MGRTSAIWEEVLDAAENAYAHEFIQQLPNGYETMVGDRGCKLSGGQCQRISIARAFLKNAPLIILDEATSALDKVSEMEVQKALNVLMKNKTVLIIAHNDASLAKADRVLEIQDGTMKDF